MLMFLDLILPSQETLSQKNMFSLVIVFCPSLTLLELFVNIFLCYITIPVAKLTQLIIKDLHSVI